MEKISKKAHTKIHSTIYFINGLFIPVPLFSS